jgi:DNA polymerase-3 subunit alpha
VELKTPSLLCQPMRGIILKILRRRSKMKDKLSFVNFHAHSVFSAADSIDSVDSVTELATMLNTDSVGISEHMNICSWIQFDKITKKKGLKGILSVEIYFYWDDQPKLAKSNHLMITAINDAGFRNILKLLYIGNLPLEKGGGYYYRARNSFNMLKEHKEGLQIGGSCLSGPVSSLLIKGDQVSARLVAQQFKETFGEFFHLEIFPHRMELQAKINREVIQIGKDLDIPVTISLDSHYATVEESQAYLINGRNRRRITKSQVEANEDCLKDADFFHKCPQTCLDILECEHGIDRGVVLGAMDYSNQLNKLITFQYNDKFEIPKCYEDDDGFLEKLLGKKLIEKFGTREAIPQVYKERLRYEYNVIKEKKFSSYFNILNDAVEFCTSEGIRLGGRGSVGGSLIAHLLKLFPLDPIEYGLSFERFLSPLRSVPPDVDLDCPSSKRTLIIEYLKNRWGEKRVTQVITFSELKAKSSIKDVATYMELPFQEVNKVCSFIPSLEKDDGALHDVPLSRAMEIPEVARFARENEGVFKYALQLEGSIKTNGVHAGGIVILPDDAENIVPVMQKKGDTGADLNVVAWEKKDLEAIGILKWDFLGLSLLEVLKDCENQLGINLDNLPLDDENAWKYAQEAKNMKCIFQLSEPVSRRYLKEAQPNSIFDLACVSSGIRPGSDWPTFRDGKKAGKYNGKFDIPEFKKVLERSYGAVLFQESLLFLFSELSDLNLGESDLLRRALEKGDQAGIDSYEEKFVTTCRYPALGKQIFEYLRTFTSYSFNLSHAMIYSLNSYWTLYLKANFPNQFLVGNIKNPKSSTKFTETEYIAELIAEARTMGLKVKPPDIFHCQSEVHYDEDSDTVYLGLSSLKGITGKPADVLIEALAQVNQGDDLEKRIKAFCDYCFDYKVETEVINKDGSKRKRAVVTKAHIRTMLNIGFFGDPMESVPVFNKLYKEKFDVMSLREATNLTLGFDYYSMFDYFAKNIPHNKSSQVIAKCIEKKTGSKNGRSWYLVNWETEFGRIASFLQGGFGGLDTGAFYLVDYEPKKGMPGTDEKFSPLKWRLIQ